MAQVVKKQEALPKPCHFHGERHKGTHILRIYCKYCKDYRVVYTCESCTKSIRTYETAQSDLNVGCTKCNRNLVVKEHWQILGEA